MYKLMEPAVKKAQAKDFKKLWLKLNRPQKLFLAMLNFIGETDNVGVWQFLYNEPHLALAALEAMQEISESRLAKNYHTTLDEVLGKAKTISALRKKSTNAKLTTERRWHAFAEGYEQLPSAHRIEKYFYTASYKKKLHKRLTDHVELHLPLLAEIQEIS